jgi:hypothetical protein
MHRLTSRDLRCDFLQESQKLLVPMTTMAGANDLTGMYGPPQSCKRKTEKDKLVCANVFGLWWSQRLLAMMDSARSLPY